MGLYSRLLMSNSGLYSLIDEDLHAINLGDSGFVVIRDGCTIFQSLYKRIKAYKNVVKCTICRRTHKYVEKSTKTWKIVKKHIKTKKIHKRIKTYKTYKNIQNV